MMDLAHHNFETINDLSSYMLGFTLHCIKSNGFSLKIKYVLLAK
jgi:hypothetical protein